MRVKLIILFSLAFFLEVGGAPSWPSWVPVVPKGASLFAYRVGPLGMFVALLAADLYHKIHTRAWRVQRYVICHVHDRLGPSWAPKTSTRVSFQRN